MKPKKTIYIIIVFAFIIISIIVISRYYKIYTFYNIPTCSMDPTYSVNQKIWGSSLLSPKKGDVVAYEADPLPYEQVHDSYDALCRIVAEEGDNIQIVNGLFFINNRLVDDTMNLSYFFKVNLNEIGNKLSEYQKKYKSFQISTDTIILNATHNEIEKLGIKNIKREIDSSTKVDPTIFLIQSNEYWTIDNLGPLVVPKDSYFLMGDNRSNSADSRYRGFIKKDKIIAKILN